MTDYARKWEYSINPTKPQIIEAPHTVSYKGRVLHACIRDQQFISPKSLSGPHFAISGDGTT